MNLKRKFLIFGIVVILISIMGVYSAQYHENATEVSGIVESANGDDVFGCCSIVLQLDGNDGTQLTLRLKRLTGTAFL